MAKVRKKTVKKPSLRDIQIAKGAAATAKIAEDLDIKPVKYKKTGRPTKFEDWMCDAVVEHMAKGYSKEACAGMLQISAETLFVWQRDNPLFSDALKAGVELSRNFWEESSIKHLTHYAKGKQLNSTVWIFSMKNRFGWTDKKEIEIGEQTRRKFGFALDVNPDLLDNNPDEPSND